jgi:centrin-1
MKNNKKTKAEKTQSQKIQKAIYKFSFSKEQRRDLKTAFDIFDKDGTGNIDIKDLKVILRALGFEPQEDEVKRLLSTINRSDEEENSKNKFSANTIDFDEFLKIMEAKLGESEEIDSLKTGFYGFCDQNVVENKKEKEKDSDNYITLRSLREVSLKLGMEVSDEELKEMMIEANQELKNQNQE